MHTDSDHLIVEVIDPETKQPLGPGEEGEPVVTTLIADAVPLIRYRTGDIGTLLPYEICPCGRTHPKISMIKGRVTQRMKVGGRNILPIDIEEIVAGIPGLGNEYQIILDKPSELERLRLKVEFKPDIRDLHALKQKVEEAIYRDLAIESGVELVPVGTLERTLFKAQRVITTCEKKK